MSLHEAMKALAARHGLKAADFYVKTVEVFIREHMAGYRHLFANDAVHICVNVPVRFAHTVRDAALARRVTPNESGLVCESNQPGTLTAVGRKLRTSNFRIIYLRRFFNLLVCDCCD